ncbi:MAG: ATP-binding protein [Gammaproteobacteria bacterium]|jgi:two-component system sensor histidine kinase GlrK|nr:ATP-binding protein [Gammaproteobacteria bacterium]
MLFCAHAIWVPEIADRPGETAWLRVSFLRTRSILQLILISFILVMVPLIVALLTAAINVDRLSKHAQRSVFEAVAATQSSRMLVEHIISMERSARQFQVLNDRALLEVYRDRHHQFQRIARGLQDLPSSQQNEILAIAEHEQTVFRLLDDPSSDAQTIAAAIESFPTINSAARAILAESSNLIGESVNELQQLARRAQNLLFWQTMSLIPLAIVLFMLFTALIIKPMRRLHQAIRRLGDGQFEHEIAISGPNDLRELGERLEWMRRRILTLENQKLMFLRHMSHELKTPLTTIREGSELLSEQLVGTLNTEQAEIAAMLRQNSLRLQKLIEDLLSFSILERDVLRVRHEPLALDQLISDVISGYRLPARAKSVIIETRVEPVAVAGDRDKLRSVVDNLVSNAVKYSPVNGRVTVSLIGRQGRAVIDVEDEGPGVDEDERGRIFNAFYQGRARASGPVKGTGLGLSITREFVHLHHGTIEVIATPHGAHFRVSLPCDAGQPAPQATDQPPEEFP